MYRLPLSFLLVATLAFPASSCTPTKSLPTMATDTTPTSQPASTAEDAVRQLIQLMIQRDTSAMALFLAPSFTLTHITGYVQSRAEWLSEVQTESMKYYSAREVSIDSHSAGGRTVVTIRHQLDARIWGSRNVWPLQQVMTLEEQDGRWLILQSVATLFR